MKLRTKINLIRKLKLTPEQVIFLEKMKISISYDTDISIEDFKEINTVLNIKLEKLIQENEEENSLILAYIISTLEYNRLGLELDFNNENDEDSLQEDEEDFDDFVDEIGGLSAVEQRHFQKLAVEKYEGIEINTMINEFYAFILENNPKILNGFDRSIYANAKSTYWKKEHIFDLWQIPTKIYEKIKDVEYKVEEILKEDVEKNSEKMFLTWCDDYKKWLKKNGLCKATKANIKDFFKSIKVKPSETLIERIKATHISS